MKQEQHDPIKKASKPKRIPKMKTATTNDSRDKKTSQEAKK